MSIANTAKYFNNLPWNKVYLRVQMLINQIFIETKKHNLKRVYSLQNYIINSNELKIFILTKIIPTIYNLNYSNNNKYKYKVLNNNSFLISIINTFCDYKCNDKNFITLKRTITQNLIYICTKPLFEGRSCKYLNNKNRLYFSQQVMKRHKYFYYLSNEYIEKKIILPRYIKKHLVNILQTVSYLDLLKLYKSKCNKNINNFHYLEYISNTENFNFLIQILTKIVLSDFNWYYFSCTKKERYYNKTSQVLKNKKSQVSSLVPFLKYNLKYEFSIGNLKISHYIFINQKYNFLINKLSHLYYISYNSINSFITICINSQLNLLINQLFNLVTKKNISKTINYKKNIYKINTLLNKLTYVFNLNNYYALH